MTLPPTEILVETAISHHRAGQLADAEALYRQILAIDPDHAQALHYLGVLAHQRGDHGAAVELINQSIALAPAPDALNNLAIALLAQQRVDEAIDACRRAIALNPSFPEAFYNLGNALSAASQNADAVAAFRQAIEQRFNYPEAHHNLGIALKATGQIDDAISAYRQAIALRPHYARSYNNLGIAHLEKTQPDDAITAFEQALALQPAFAEAQINLAQAYFSSGSMGVERMDLAAAVKCFRRAVELDAGSAPSWNALGAALNSLGQFEQAADCFRHALAIRPEPRFFQSLATTGRNSATASEIDNLERRLADPMLPMEERITAGFVLGKLLDEADRFDEAFACVSAANQLFKDSRAARGIRHDGQESRQMVDEAIATFTPAFFASRRPWGNPADRPVFIVGMPRSGTSLVEQIAASHPAVFGTGELQLLQQLPIRAILPAQWSAADVEASAKRYSDGISALAGPTPARITDKMPSNLFLLGIGATLFPNARVIFCRRDPRDNCLSCFFQHFDGDAILFSYDLADCARQLLEARRLTAHWQKFLPLRMLEVDYEELVQNQESESRRIIDFLGLPWNAACLNFHRASRPVMTASVWQVRQPIYSRSVGRWRHYQRHLAALEQVLADAS